MSVVRFPVERCRSRRDGDLEISVHDVRAALDAVFQSRERVRAFEDKLLRADKAAVGATESVVRTGR